jgi:fumarate reductase subunit D
LPPRRLRREAGSENITRHGARQAIEGEARLDSFLRWTDNPLTKAAEFGFVLLLATHLAGGVRLLLLEFVGWRDWHQRAVAATLGFAAAVGLVFLLNVRA